MHAHVPPDLSGLWWVPPLVLALLAAAGVAGGIVR